MSLINDALKKAQKTHSTDNAPPPPIGQSGPSSHGMGKSQLLKIFFAAVVVLGIFGSAIAFLVVGLMDGSKDEPETDAPVTAVASIPTPTPTPASSQTPPPQKVIPISKPAPPIPQPVANTAPVPIKPVATPVKKTVAPAPVPVPVIAKTESKPAAPKKGFDLVRQTVTQGSLNAGLVDEVVDSASKPATPVPVAAKPEPVPVAASPKPTIQARPAPVAKPRPTPAPSAPRATTQNPILVEYIEKMEIQGIRLSGTNSKVLMDNKVFRLNSIINRDLKLRVISISKERIIFIDDAGIRYTKYY